MKTTPVTIALLSIASSLAHAQADMSTGTNPTRSRALPLASQALQDMRDTEGADRITARAAVTYDKLSNNLASWREYSMAANHDIDKQQFIEAGLVRTSRFDLEDNQINALYLRKFTPDLVATIDGNVSPTHRVLPKYTLSGTISYVFLPATVGQFGVKTTSYDETRVNQVTIGVERYIGAFSLGATWRPARAFGKSIDGGEVRINYYYGERSSISMLLGAGEEVTPIGEFKTITKVRAGALFGHHWLDQNWAVTYAVSRTRQGDFYNRTGVNIGLQYAF